MYALNANGKTKQVRKPRITVLPEEVATNKVIIQSNLNSEVTNQQKGQLRQDIARKGSNCGVCVRTPDQVREKLSLPICIQRVHLFFFFFFLAVRAKKTELSDAHA